MGLPSQDKVNVFYNGSACQIFVAGLICANFLTNIIEKEIDPKGIKYEDTFGSFGLFYNICFTIELGVNMYAHWFKLFWASNWNIFDVVVVTIGIVNTLQLPLPPAFSMLRMMRAFRVFRLFKRVRSLNKIIVAIVHAVPGVMNAFLILAIVMSIYAILAVEFYYEVGEDCREIGGDERFLTARGYCQGEEYFGTFTKSFYSFFQVLTGESWSEAVARPLIWFYLDDPIRAVGSGMFFVTYMLITAFVLTNVVVAVLLDKMVDPEVADAAASRHPDEADVDEGEAEAEVERDVSAVSNGEESSSSSPITPKPTPDDFLRMMDTVTEQVTKLMIVSDRMSGELDTFRSDAKSMRNQVSHIITSATPISGNTVKDFETTV